jgi:hypothetical protein
MALTASVRSQDEGTDASSRPTPAPVVVPTTARIIWNIPDGTPPPPQAPKPAFVVPTKDNLTTTTHEQGGRTITIQKIYIELVAMSTNGLIAATAERDDTSAREIVLLEPIAVRAFPTVHWDDNTPHDPKGLSQGIDRMSSFASDGAGKTNEFWITASTGGGSTLGIFLSAANPAHPIEMTADPHCSRILDSSKEYETITGSGTTSVDIPVTFKISGGMVAENHPVQLKVMKKRTVKIALHEVKGRDGNGNPTSPRFMPNPAMLASYLNLVYGPQVNVNFEVSSPTFIEAGPDSSW